MFNLSNHLACRERIASDPKLKKIWDRNILISAVQEAQQRLDAEKAKLIIFDKLGEI